MPDLTTSAYRRLPKPDQRMIEEWVTAHLGSVKGVADCGVDGTGAWFRRYKVNAQGKRYLAGDGRPATELIRVPVQRPWPLAVTA